ncbi:MAG: GntR family transcriptional regulator [Limnohabitans sp.]
MPKSSSTNIAERVVSAILNQNLKPGERLGEQELANLFGVSRTLVRQALIELQSRGFVEVRPRMGWYVVEPSFEEARETYAARRVIEPGMLLDAGKPLQSVIKSLRKHIADEKKAIESKNAAQRSVLLADFHVCLAECLGNRLLTTMMVDLSARTTLVSALYQSATEAQDSNEDHADIVDAIAAGNMKKAADLMRKHIDQLETRLDDRFVQAGTSRERMLAKLVEPSPKYLNVKL